MNAPAPGPALLANLLDKAYEHLTPAEALKHSPSILHGVSERQAELLKEAFRISTVEQLANARAFRMAAVLATLAQFTD